jgi:hypothetical protein
MNLKNFSLSHLGRDEIGKYGQKSLFFMAILLGFDDN